jgi:small subunit ribosomal protein S9
MKKEGFGSFMHHGVGRRKKCVARVWLKNGVETSVKINGTVFSNYFDSDITRRMIETPFKTINSDKKFSVNVNVFGGGKVGQAEAVRLGIARALVSFNEGWKQELRKQHLLTVDGRIKERKKYGQRGARRKFQFVKR